jgi:hypothetical protein
MKKLQAGLLVGMVLISIAIGYILAYVITVTPVFAPANHLAVASSLMVTDSTANTALTMQYMGGVFSISLPALNEFPPGHSYAISRWEFDLNGQIQAFMVIAGPGVDGKTYGVEISRKCWDALVVAFPGGKTFTFDAVTAVGQVSPGYVSYEFIP